MKTMTKQFSIILFLVVLVAFVPACGDKKLKTEGVTGTVTLDGQPLPNATVYFTPLDGSGNEAVGTTDSNGVYRLQTLLGKVDAGTTPGKYSVKFSCYEEFETGKTYTNDEGKEIPETDERSIIPQKYESAQTSGFEAEVVKGANTFDFDLQSK